MDYFCRRAARGQLRYVSPPGYRGGDVSSCLMVRQIGYLADCIHVVLVMSAAATYMYLWRTLIQLHAGSRHYRQYVPTYCCWVLHSPLHCPCALYKQKAIAPLYRCCGGWWIAVVSCLLSCIMCTFSDSAQLLCWWCILLLLASAV
jgi:hypothetical protein